MTRIVFASLALLGTTLTLSAADKEPRLFELRVYTINEGKLDAFAGAVRDTATKLYAKHGMTAQGFFVPVENKDNMFYSLLAHANVAARTASWAALRADPDGLKRALNDALRQVGDLKPKELLQRRYDRLQSYGRFIDTKDR